MQEMSPKARFDALARVLSFDSSSVDAVRHSIRHLIKDVNELVRMVDEAMKADVEFEVFGDLGESSRDRMQSLLASFIMRTINCNYDEEFCNYAVEVSMAEDVPQNLFSVGLTLANEYVTRTLATQVEDSTQLLNMLCAWNRLTSILRELTRR